MKNIQLWRIDVKETVYRSYDVYAESPDQAKEQLSEGVYVKVQDSDASIEEIIRVEEVTDPA
jgi:hypothetical protein